MRPSLFKLSCFLLICYLLITAGCRPEKPVPAYSRGSLTEQRLPADCISAIDTFITGLQVRTNPDGAIAVFNVLAARYRGKDSLAYASMRAYAVQAWDVKSEGDSMVAACEEGLRYFESQLRYLDMRSMCHLYSGWGYYYKKNQLTANYFFSLAGNDLTDTIYLPATREYITSKYPPATKAALLQEIASIARISGLNEQARRYIRLSMQSLAQMPVPDPYLQAVISLEGGTIYTRLKQYDSAAYCFRSAMENAALSDPGIQQLYRERKADFYFNTGSYDSAILLSLRFQAAAKADTVHTAKAEAAQQLLILAKAYTASGRHREANAVLDTLAPAMAQDAAILADVRINYLEAKAANLLLARAGSEGYRLLEQYAAAKDQLYDQQRLAAITDMDARYKMRRREDAIRRLNGDNEAYARKVRRQTRLLVIALLSVLLLVSLVIIIYQRQARRRLQASVDKMELEQRLLRSQMEPHFIFNTLAVLQGLIRREEKDQSIKYLNQFARLLRISLEHAREGFVPLRGEVHALGHYLTLQQMRFQDAFTFEITQWKDYDEEADDLLLPPMLLQPFAENAVHHGMKGLNDRKGHISISLSREEGMVRCTIEDNGAGYDPDAPVAAGEKQSLATVITRERLAILSKKTGGPGSLSITSAPGQGSRVDLLIPFIIKGHSGHF